MSHGAGRPARRLGVVVNPTAGTGRAARAGTVVRTALRAAGHDVLDLSAATAPLALARARAAQGLDALVVVGGDGMVHLGAQAVAGTGVPLGIVAAGTGNDFAHTLGLPVGDPRAAVAGLCAALDAGAAGVRAVDAAHVSPVSPVVPDRAAREAPRQGTHQGTHQGRWVAGAVSAGLDAAVNARADAMRRPRGSSRYVLAAVAELARYRPWPYRLTFSDVVPDPAGRLLTAGTWTGRAALVTAANAPRIGGGIRVAPTARVDDGRLDVVVATDLSRPAAVRAFVAMLRGTHLRHPQVHVVRARSVLVEPGPPTGRDRQVRPVAFGDGERLGHLPLRVTAHRGALRVLAVPPRGTARDPGGTAAHRTSGIGPVG